MDIQSAAELKSKIASAAAETKAVLAGETGIFKRLIAEHAEILSLLKAVQASADGEQRAALFETLRIKITVHAEAEEKEFYSLLAGREETAETIQIHQDEHRTMAALLTTVQNLEPLGGEWDELVGKLHVLVTEHVQREENKLFDASKPAISAPKAETIESRFVERKVEEAARLDDGEPQQGRYDLPLP
jgi:hypothetical protein